MKPSCQWLITVFCTIAVSICFSNAENICNETPPANRGVDGIPAYAQCSTSTGNVYSNDGLNTRSTSGGTGWVRTQFGGGYQCTELAHRYLAFRWNIKSVPMGNAGTWGDTTLPAGLVKTTAPVHGDLIVFAPGSCGAAASTGHVAVIDVVNGASLTIVEQNGAARRTCKASCAKYFLHAQANNGTAVARTTVPAGENPGMSVRLSGDVLFIQLSAEFDAGASLCLYDAQGRKLAEISGLREQGKLSFKRPAFPSAVIMVSIRSGNRTFTRRLAVDL
jgi:surface antigen